MRPAESYTPRLSIASPLKYAFSAAKLWAWTEPMRERRPPSPTCWSWKRSSARPMNRCERLSRFVAAWAVANGSASPSASYSEAEMLARSPSPTTVPRIYRPAPSSALIRRARFGSTSEVPSRRILLVTATGSTRRSSPTPSSAPLSWVLLRPMWRTRLRPR